MCKTLQLIAEELKNSDRKVQLIYAFNGIGKTRLSREFKSLVCSQKYDTSDTNEAENVMKVLYYNAFTEDLFYWNNGAIDDEDPKLRIHPNTFTDWIFNEQGQESNIVSNFQHYTNSNVSPRFENNYNEVLFSFSRDGEEPQNIKISKGEESNFVWCVFYSLLEQVIDILNIAETTERETNQFDQLEYVFIDDPVSSLDDNHLIQLAVDIAKLVKESTELKFIITTHNTTFYNILYNELNIREAFLLDKQEDGTFKLLKKQGDSNRSFSYHLYLIETLNHAVKEQKIERFHFMLLRNLYEKTASFLGYPRWSELLPNEEKEAYYNRVIQFSSHSTLASEMVAEPSPQEKKMVKFLLDHLVAEYNFQKGSENV